MAHRQVLSSMQRAIRDVRTLRAGISGRGRLVEAWQAGRTRDTWRRYTLLTLGARNALLRRPVEAARRPRRRHAVASGAVQQKVHRAVPLPSRVGNHRPNYVGASTCEAGRARLTLVGVGVEDVLRCQARLALLRVVRIRAFGGSICGIDKLCSGRAVNETMLVCVQHPFSQRESNVTSTLQAVSTIRAI